MNHMNTLEQINSDLQNMGFTIDGNEYKYEKKIQHQVIINGRRMIQEEVQVLYMTYIGEGYEVDNEDNEIENTKMYGFDLKDENKNPITSVFITNANDFKHYIQI